MIQHLAKMIQNDTTFSENDIMIQNLAKMIQNDTKFSENDTK